MTDIAKQLKQRARELGFDDCRITSAAAPEGAGRLRAWLEDGCHGEMGYLERNAHKRVDPQLVLSGARSVVTLATAYSDHGSDRPSPDQSSAESAAPQGRIARYARYTDYHDVLAERLKCLTEFLDQAAAVEGRSLWYVDTGPLLERELAQRAGIGFIGKHTNLISRRLGNWIFLSEIITTAQLTPDAPEANRCGTCSRCIAACPTGAITEPFRLDSRLCISYLTIELKGPIPEELRPAIGNRIYGCDDCLEACPWNRFARMGRVMKDSARADLDQPRLLELLKLDQPGFKAMFKGTPLLRTKRRGVLRNVCVALGNIGDASALPALRAAAGDPEPIIAEHAAWAVAQIESREAGRD
jgi:epoxyqueuosine reductase